MIVLHKIKHKESGLIVQGYTERGGRETLFLKSGARSAKNGNLSQLHPLSIIEVSLSSSRYSEIPVIKEFFTAYNLSSIRGEVFKSAIAIFISELISKSVREQEKNMALYSFLHDSILTLESLKSGVSNFHPYFMVGFCKYIGYSPEINNIGDGFLFDIPTASYLSGPLFADNSFPEESGKLLHAISGISAKELDSIKINGRQRYMFIRDMIRYLSYHTGHEIKTESLEVLREVFE
ncbi:MAG: DNA repair protein RecO [Bacteroidales bacterium]|jgi:DNA repair protein RecO (recombination protein O)|nr:DNA repair protein RecO [Bacteroidales bacterium]